MFENIIINNNAYKLLTKRKVRSSLCFIQAQCIGLQIAVV